MTVQSQDRAALIRAALARTRLFAGWPDAVLDAMSAASEVRRFRKGQMVVRQGDPPSGLWLVTEGSLVNSRSWFNGRRIVYEHLLPGQVTCVLPTLDGMPAAFDVIAKENTAALFIPRATALAAFRDDPERLMQLIQLLCRRTRLDYETMTMKMLNTPRGQLAKIILYFGRGPGMPESEFEVPVGISQEDVADTMGVSRQTVNKEMMPLVRAGILAWRYRKIYVLDFKRLYDIVKAEGPLPPEIEAYVFERPTTAFRAAD